MKIAFLGWGSLIWNPRNLKIIEEWHSDGPFLPVEFARISKDKRLTLVLYPNGDRVQVLWAYGDVNRLEEAIESIRQREGTRQNRIGFISFKEDKAHCQVVPKILNEVRSWAIKKNLDAVVWTDLPSNFREKTEKELNRHNVIEYLRSLRSEERKRAREYIEKAPSQVITKIRHKIEQELGWKHENINR